MLVSDSQVTVHNTSNLTSRSPRLLVKLREPRNLFELHGVTLSTRYLPSVLNCWADRLSCRRESYHWDLPPTALSLLARSFQLSHPFTFDGNDLLSYIYPQSQLVAAPRPSLHPVYVSQLIAHRSELLAASHWTHKPWSHSAVGHAQLSGYPNTLTTPMPTVVFNFGSSPVAA